MRALTESEMTKVLEKMYKFVGRKLALIVDAKNNSENGSDSSDGQFCFRMNKNRVYYIRETLIKRGSASNIPKKKLMSIGTQIGKFTKTENFRLTIQSLDLLSRYAKNKVFFSLSPPWTLQFYCTKNTVMTKVQFSLQPE